MSLYYGASSTIVHLQQTNQIAKYTSNNSHQIYITKTKAIPPQQTDLPQSFTIHHIIPHHSFSKHLKLPYTHQTQITHNKHTHNKQFTHYTKKHGTHIHSRLITHK